MSNLKEKSINGVIWNLLEKFGVQIIKLILGVILARILTPADYGLIGMITVFISISIIFIDSGFGLAYIQKKDATHVDASTIFYFNLVVSILFFIILWFLAPVIADFYDQPELISLLRVLSIVLIINAFGLIQVTQLTKNVDFKKKTILKIISAILSSSAGITAALIGYGVWSLVIQSIAKSIIENLGLWFFYRWRPLPYFSIKSLKSLLSFSTWSLFMSIIATIFDNLYIIVIGKFFPAAQLGYYTKANQFQQTVARTPSYAVGTVAFPIFSKLQDDKILLKKAIKKFNQHTIFFIAPFAALLFVIAKPFFLLLLTEKWSPMVPYFQMLLIAGLLFPLHMVNVQVLSAQGKMKLNFNISMVKNSFRIINVIVMYRFGVIYIIYGEIFFSFISLIINTYFTKKYVNYGMLEQMRDISVVLITSAFLTVLGYFLVESLENNYIKIILSIICVLGLYVVLIYYFNKKLVLDNLNIIRTRFLKKS